MLGHRPLRFELPIAAAEFERRLETLLAKPAGRMYSGELTFTGRVASGLVQVRVRRLSRQALRLRVEGRYEATSNGVSFRGQTLPPREVFLPLALLLAAPLSMSQGSSGSLFRNGWVGLGIFAILAVAWHLYLLVRLGERVERELRELAH